MTSKLQPIVCIPCLCCPSCGSDYLHHGDVTIFERVEDPPGARVTTVSASGCLTRMTDGKGNPSSRRDGLTIQFWCEGCSSRPVLRIAQHKGSTFLDWEVEPGAGLHIKFGIFEMCW
jgi:hypothetical protein